MQNHGTDPRTRMRLIAERVEAMKAIWTQDEASFSGEFVNFDRIWSWPKPAQRPHPPVLVGGNGPTVLDRALAFGDAWFPNYSDDVVDRARELKSRADRPIGFEVISAPANAAKLEQLREAGCRRAVRWIPSGGLSVVERALERWESAIAEFTGEA
jgi:alkanesulfonate monooxygenase SsuD/methylene tetrahydromethanopterin reductase-like flavin-dependent oxidoreductase (luciferase family)